MSADARLSRRALIAGALTTCAAPAWAADDPLAGRFGGPFRLTAHDGRQIADTDLHGSWLLIYFGYTHCPDICPDDLAVMDAALKKLGERADRVQPLFVTVDPQRDTQAVLAEYVQSFHPRLIGLTGSEAQIADITRAYKVHRRIYQLANARPGEYSVDHGSLTYLMGPDGAFRTLIPHDTNADRMAEIVGRYLGR